MGTLRYLHRLSACGLGLFLAAHLANHVLAVFGLAAHQHGLSALRIVYRSPWVEPALLLCALWQVGSGLTLLIWGWRDRRGGVAWLQALSGGYLALFLCVHVAAVLFGRSFGLDTNFHFAAAGFHVPAWPCFFAPYYCLAIVALFGHVGCAISWSIAAERQHRQVAIVSGFALAGTLIGVILVITMAGGFYRVDVPADYRRIFVR